LEQKKYANLKKFKNKRKNINLQAEEGRRCMPNGTTPDTINLSRLKVCFF